MPVSFLIPDPEVVGTSLRSVSDFRLGLGTCEIPLHVISDLDLFGRAW